ncbi:hypothetical protein JCM4814A_86910 [Streptomyces phaeofaciens JCM 4814]|uniref:Uncharacterized protein n=1 Tax=Streptomyces phaeofaciens TaxID=68254 RepID=A0A918LT26_9ACTN|nr:hypothetical protein [Streptomyces phaeofaciens]GGT45260.1 hypothetical protein GCM10010226_22490 [Streptomyces phaeofaciens]
MTTPHDRRPEPGDTTIPESLAKTRVEDDDDYSATLLESHWIQRPDDATTMLDPSGSAAPLGGVAATVPEAPGSTVPHGRVDGTMLRFGPGVTTAALSHGVHTTLAPVALPVRRHRRLRRHALPALILIAALVFLFWRGHSAPALSVRDVSVTTVEQDTGCDDTADVVGVVRTDGRAGEFSYRWVRNDGTTSDVLHATVARGSHEVRVHLLWTFQGRGHHAAEAELQVLSPSRHTATGRFSYDCP